MSYADSQKISRCLTEVPFKLADFQGVPVHQDLLLPLDSLVLDATSAGFDLAVASGFRSVERQCQIWNAKALGLRPVLDDTGVPLEVGRLDPEALMFAILRWSALPGTSLSLIHI